MATTSFDGSTRRKSKSKVAHVVNSSERKKRRSGNNNSIVCPVCTITVRGDDHFEQHYNQELEKAQAPYINLDCKKKQYKMRLKSEIEEEENKNILQSLEERTKELYNVRKRKYDRYANMFLTSMKRTKNTPTTTAHDHVTIRSVATSETNIDDRITTRSLSASAANTENTVTASSEYELVSCAVCNEFLETTTSTKHLAKCFAKHDYQFSLYSSDEESESEEETVEEFNWAGQNWIRTSSQLDSDYLRREGRLTRLVMEDGDEELDIDGDTDTQFGQQQFSENDVIPCCSDETEKERDAEELLRNAITGCSGPKNSSISDTWNEQQITDEYTTLKTLESMCEGDPHKLIELLKRKIFKLEDRLDKDVYKCPICMGPYVNPVVSINCWHTCCSECWMRVLGAKKLCPKCNNIVSPSQLRKIFL